MRSPQACISPVGQSFLLHRKHHQPEKENACDRHKGLCLHIVKAMIHAAKKVGRHGVRNRAIILLMFRHGLRTAELVALKWIQIDLAGGYIELHRVKHGHDSIHPLRSPEVRA